MTEQKHHSPGKILAAATLVCATGLIATWEGMRTKAYPDIVGVWTICNGYTHGVKPGDVKTPVQCEGLLHSEIAKVDAALTRCGIPEDDIGPRAAAISLAYNVGYPAVCRSTFARMLRAGDIPGACNQLKRWAYAKGKWQKGLANRREAERKVCLTPNSVFLPMP